MSILGRRISTKVVLALVSVMVSAGGLIPLMSKSATHEVTLVAHDMAFHVDSDTGAANPIINVKAGETVHVVLKNRDRGMKHDFTVPAASAATDLVQWNGDAEVTFVAPATPGTYEYMCRPHELMMKGMLRVTK